jgi:hypothetical protein
MADRLPGPSSTRLFLLATLAFAWTAGSLFLELPYRGGLLGQIGWIGLLGAGPVAIVLVIMALRRYSREARLPGVLPPARSPGPPLRTERPEDPTMDR